MFSIKNVPVPCKADNFTKCSPMMRKYQLGFQSSRLPYHSLPAPVADTNYTPFPYHLLPFPEPFTPCSLILLTFSIPSAPAPRTVYSHFTCHLQPAPLLFTSSSSTLLSRSPYRLLPAPFINYSSSPNGL